MLNAQKIYENYKLNGIEYNCFTEKQICGEQRQAYLEFSLAYSNKPH